VLPVSGVTEFDMSEALAALGLDAQLRVRNMWLQLSDVEPHTCKLVGIPRGDDMRVAVRRAADGGGARWETASEVLSAAPSRHIRVCKQDVPARVVPDYDFRKLGRPEIDGQHVLLPADSKFAEWYRAAQVAVFRHMGELDCEAMADDRARNNIFTRDGRMCVSRATYEQTRQFLDTNSITAATLADMRAVSINSARPVWAIYTLEVEVAAARP
jgi:hypothetical protein